MSLFDKAKKIAKLVATEISKPDSFYKGEAFEDYVRKYVFPKEKYKLIHRSHNYATNKEDYVESSLKPDFEFQCIDTKQKFHVEVKFRIGEYNKSNKIQWCEDYQLKRYKAIDKKQKVFIAFGIGDNPNRPEEIFLMPLSKINFIDLYDSVLNKYSFYLEKPVFPSYLWNL